MRITYYLLNAWAGRGTVSTTFGNASLLAARGHEVTVVSVVRPRVEPRLELPADVTVEVLADLAVGLGPKALRASREPSREVPADENRYRRYSRLTDRLLAKDLRRRVEGVVIGTRPGINLALARHCPASAIRIGQEHLFLDVHRDKPLQMAAMREAYPDLDALVCLTDDDAGDYARRLGIVTAAIPNAVPPPTAVATAASLTDSRTVIAVGRLSGQKAFDRLVAAMTRVDPGLGWKARIFGAGGRQAELQALIDTLGAPVELMGFTTDIDAELASAGIFAMTSRFEGFPMVMLEAMAVGLPVVTVDFRTGCRQLTSPQTGLIVGQDDPADLAHALETLMSAPEQRVAMGAASRRVAEQYTPAAVVDRWEHLFETLRRRRRTGWFRKTTGSGRRGTVLT